MIVTDEIHAIATCIGKSENMRVTAGRMFASLWDYVTTPGTDGAQQVINAGEQPTQRGLWWLICRHPSFPKKLGSSFTTGRRLLDIGRAEDPTEAERREREARAESARERRDAERREQETRYETERAARRAANRERPVTEPIHVEPECNSDAPAYQSDPTFETVVDAIKALPTAEFERLKVWFRTYCGFAQAA
jgi:hypothetical protein